MKIYTLNFTYVCGSALSTLNVNIKALSLQQLKDAVFEEIVSIVGITKEQKWLEVSKNIKEDILQFPIVNIQYLS